MNIKISHLCLKVANVDRSEQFYAGVLGMTVVSRDVMNGKPLVVMGEGLGLAEARESDYVSHDHIGLRVDSVEKVIIALKEAEIPIVSGPKESPYGMSVYFYDPDGNRLECHDKDRQ